MGNQAFSKYLVIGMLILLWGGGVYGQDGPAGPLGKGAEGSSMEQRVALVIGNDAYEAAPLRNPVNDARGMARILSQLGFQVTQRENLGQKEMKQEIQAFGQKLMKGGVGLFYYAGHGMQVNGRNYLIPVGARIEHEKQVEFESVDMGAMLAEMEHARNRMNIVILDACRDNPFARSFRSTMQGLASVNAPTGTLIAYATAPGSVANDGPSAHGIYTGELVKVIQRPGLRIEDVFKQVRSAVREATQGKQIPWESSSLEGDFFFRAPSQEPPRIAVTGKEPAPSVAPIAPVARGEHQVKVPKTWREPVTGIQFVWVPGGCYLMGSPLSEDSRHMDEGPVHEVCVKDLWFGKYEVTNEELRKLHPDHNSGAFEKHSLNGDRQPAVHLSWEDAKSFAQWLTEQNGGQYRFRLPTEAEWEYAARGGTSTSRYWGDDSQGACEYENVADLTAQKLWGWQDIHPCDDGYAATAPVGSFQPNGFGLYDMLGNASEWCEDIYGVDMYANYDRDNPLHRGWGAGLDRVVRGGHWHGGPESSRSASRASGMPRAMNDDLGVRLVREP